MGGIFRKPVLWLGCRSVPEDPGFAWRLDTRAAQFL